MSGELMVKWIHMNLLFLEPSDLPEPANLSETKFETRMRALEPRRVRAGIEQKEESERGKEIAQEALKEEKRIWMRRTGGALEQVFVVGVHENSVECCWVQPDGSVMVKDRSFSQIAEDDVAAGEEGVVARSEGVAAYELFRNLRAARKEKAERGAGYNRIEPLHIFNPDTGEFHQIRDDVRMSQVGSSDFSPKDVEDGESPFERVDVRMAAYEDREKSISTTPIQLMRDQMAYFLNIKRHNPKGQEGIEEYIRKTRERELANMIARRREEWEFKDIMRKEGGYDDRATVGDATVRVFFEPRNHGYLLIGWKEKSAGTRAGWDEDAPRDEFEMYVNTDWNLSKDGAKKAFEFAVAQLKIGKSVADTGVALEKYIESLSTAK